MAEHALLARELPDGRYAVAASRWGGTDRALGRVCAGVTPTTLPDVEWRPRRHEPDFPATVASLDLLAAELCYRIVDGELTVFLPLWFGLPLSTVRAAPTAGALVAVDSLADARACRRRFRSLRRSLADATTAGSVSWAAAPYVLTAGVDALGPRESYLSVAGVAELLYPMPGPDRP